MLVAAAAVYRQGEHNLKSETERHMLPRSTAWAWRAAPAQADPALFIRLQQDGGHQNQ